MLAGVKRSWSVNALRERSLVRDFGALVCSKVRKRQALAAPIQDSGATVLEVGDVGPCHAQSQSAGEAYSKSTKQSLYLVVLDIRSGL